MSSALNDLLTTDANLDRIARRDSESFDDDLLSDLAAFALAVDEPMLPVLELIEEPALLVARQPVSRAHKGGFALAATVGLVLSTSGVAAAVSGDALAPLHYVANRMLDFGPERGGSHVPGWDLDGSRPVGTIATTGITTSEAARPASRAKDSGTASRVSWVQWPAQVTAGHRQPVASPVHGTSGGRTNGGHSPGSPGMPGGSDGGGTPTSPGYPSHPSNPRHGHVSGGTARQPVQTGPPMQLRVHHRVGAVISAPVGTLEAPVSGTGSTAIAPPAVPTLSAQGETGTAAGETGSTLAR
jgi:hypothetical protein